MGLRVRRGGLRRLPVRSRTICSDLHLRPNKRMGWLSPLFRKGRFGGVSGSTGKLKLLVPMGCLSPTCLYRVDRSPCAVFRFGSALPSEDVGEKASAWLDSVLSGIVPEAKHTKLTVIAIDWDLHDAPWTENAGSRGKPPRTRRQRPNVASTFAPRTRETVVTARGCLSPRAPRARGCLRPRLRGSLRARARRERRCCISPLPRRGIANRPG